MALQLQTAHLVSRLPLRRRLHSLTTRALCQINQSSLDSLLILPLAQTVFHLSLKFPLKTPPPTYVLRD
jgi:hypothetical protein